MSLIDFTIANNEQIRSYFKGSDEYIPSSELIYLHEHPLIKESFLREIEVLVNKATICLIQNNVKGIVLEKFILATQRLGAHLPDISKDNAPHILEELRNVYKLCIDLLDNFNFK